MQNFWPMLAGPALSFKTRRSAPRSQAHQHVICRAPEPGDEKAHAPLHAIDERILKEAGRHGYAVALHQMFYNSARIHQTLKVTPAMATGVTEKLWELSDIIATIDAWEADRRATSVQYEIERERIGEGYLVHKHVRY